MSTDRKHDPANVKAKKAAREARWAEESWQRSKKWALESAAQEMLDLLKESQSNIGGDWRERRDAVIKKAENCK